MKSISFIIILVLFASCEKDSVYPAEYYQCKGLILENNQNHPKSQDIEELIADMVASGVPGLMLSVHDQSGYWSDANGVADLASDIPLQACNITRVGSTVKTFTAVTIFLLQEDGLLDINDLVTKYLSSNQIKGLKNAEKATIKQLLQHSSGIFNYIQSAQFQTASLNDLIKDWQPDELLSYARGKEPFFAPGSDYLYSNTNYILLGMIIEKITGEPFYEIFRARIFEPQGLIFTRFAASDPVPDGIIRGYVDLYSKFNLTNATYYSGWDYYTADGGLISNAYDLNVFLTKLFAGEILSEASMQQMMDWQLPKEENGEGFKTHYGLGIFKIDTEFGPAYIHSGDAIGYFATMVYFPGQQTTITWSANANYGRIDKLTQSKEAMEKVFEVVLE